MYVWWRVCWPLCVCWRYHKFQTYFGTRFMLCLFTSLLLPLVGRMNADVIHQFFHVYLRRETRDATACVFIRLMFAISDKLCCFGISNLQLSAHHSAFCVNNRRGDTDTRLLLLFLLFSFCLELFLQVLSVHFVLLFPPFFRHTHIFTYLDPQAMLVS